jgi:hypothetical protein
VRRHDHDIVADGRRRFGEAREATPAERSVVTVACPHPNCGRVATAAAPDAETELTVTRSAALFGDYEEVPCPAGHKVFVHHCETS